MIGQVTVGLALAGLLTASIYTSVHMVRRCKSTKESLATAHKINNLAPLRGKPTDLSQTQIMLNVAIHKIDALASLMKDFVVYAGMYIILMGMLFVAVHARALCCAGIPGA